MRNPGLSPSYPPLHSCANSAHMGSSFAACWHTGRRALLAQENSRSNPHPGMARKSWLDLGILANMAQGSQEQPRKLQEQPKSTHEWPGGPPGWIWASCTLSGPLGHPGSWAGGRAARNSPGSSRSNPQSTHELPGRAPGCIWASWPTWLTCSLVELRVHG